MFNPGFWIIDMHRNIREHISNKPSNPWLAYNNISDLRAVFYVILPIVRYMMTGYLVRFQWLVDDVALCWVGCGLKYEYN